MSVQNSWKKICGKPIKPYQLKRRQDKNWYFDLYETCLKKRRDDGNKRGNKRNERLKKDKKIKEDYRDYLCDFHESKCL